MQASELEADDQVGVVCLGEALVDLICPDRVADPSLATRFDAHFGGALANVAVAARRAGAPAALAGGCGGDDWGRFLRDRLRDEGVGLDFHAELDDAATPFAFATLDPQAEPTFRIHGEGIDAGIASLAGREVEIADRAAGIVVGSNTFPDRTSRELTLEVCAAARDRDVPILFDPNLRPGRWPDLEEPRRLSLELAAGATLLKCNLGEARWLTGIDSGEAEEVATALADLGPRLVVVTAGTAPAVARGACEITVAPPAVEMVSPLGAGDAFMGTLAAGLLAAEWRLADAGEAIERAARAGAEACGRLGAID